VETYADEDTTSAPVMAATVSEVMRVTKADPVMPMAVVVSMVVVVVNVAVIVMAVVARLVPSREVMTAMFTNFVRVAIVTSRSSTAADDSRVMVPETNRPGGFPPVVIPPIVIPPVVIPPIVISMVCPQWSEPHRNESGGQKQHLGYVFHDHLLLLA